MRLVAAGSSRSPVYPVGEGAAPSPRCSRRQPCRAYPGGFNPDQHGSTFQAEPLAAALNTGYCLLPNRGIGIAIPRAVQELQCGIWEVMQTRSHTKATRERGRVLCLVNRIQAVPKPAVLIVRCRRQWLNRSLKIE